MSIARIGVGQCVHALDELNVRGRQDEGVCGSLVHQIVLIKECIKLVYRRRVGRGPPDVPTYLASRIVCTAVVPIIGQRDAVCSKRVGLVRIEVRNCFPI